MLVLLILVRWACADLFNWATGQSTITKYQAMECARRQQGRSWEVLYDKLMELGGCTAAAAAVCGE